MENLVSQDLNISVMKVDTPDYKVRIAEGLPLPVNPYSLVKTFDPVVDVGKTVYYKDGRVIKKTVNQKASSYINASLLVAKRRAYEADIVSRATNKCLDKIKAQSLPIVQLYVERKQTASALAKLVDECWFIARNVKRPSKVFRHFDKTTHGSTAKRRIRAAYQKARGNVKSLLLDKGSSVGDLWLQYRMFLTPSYHDVMSSISAASEYEQKIRRFKVKAGIKHTDSFRLSYDSYSLGIPIAERPGRISVTGGCSAVIHYQISDSTLAAVSSLGDPLATMWDLVPWSFIVDRFADIGSYLERMHATIGTTFTSGSISSKFVWEGKPDGPWVNSYYPNKLTWSINSSGTKEVWEKYPSRALFNELSVKRTVLSSFPTPVLEYPFNQGWKQITDEIVLLRQFLKRKV